MLYNMSWLTPGSSFPPVSEATRITRYRQNARLFDGDHFDDPVLRSRNMPGLDRSVDVYLRCANRISQVIGNFEDVVSFPTLLNYQRLMSLKTADLVCGEYPSISGSTAEENEELRRIRDLVNFDEKLYSTVLDISRYGDAVWRIYRDESGQNVFTCWDPTQWYPIVSQDGTNTVLAHCLCWVENVAEAQETPDYRLHVQVHPCSPRDVGTYEHRVYRLDRMASTIGDLVASERVRTGLNICAVQHLRAFVTTSSIYGYDDYMPIDSILAEIMARTGQISRILDKHADPNVTGPVSMLSLDPNTGEYYLKTGKFFAVSPGEEHPEYMTWDGQLSSAFKQLELLINQLYILSEMGAALLGGDGPSGGQAISGTAFRFKMVNPLAKARRISNALSRPVRHLFATLSETSSTPTDVANVSIEWSDGLPDDPRENVELAKLATGATSMMPLEKAIMEYFGRSNEEAKLWLQMLAMQQNTTTESSSSDPNHPGPQDGTGVNSSAKGSQTGLNDFHGLNN